MFQQQSLKKLMALLMLALLLGVSFSFLGGSSSVHAASNSCTTWNVYVSGGEAHWTKCISSSVSTVDGWVKDTDADGRCAQVYAIFNNGATPSPVSACPKGTIKYFTWTQNTNGVSVYLRTVG